PVVERANRGARVLDDSEKSVNGATGEAVASWSPLVGSSEVRDDRPSFFVIACRKCNETSSALPRRRPEFFSCVRYSACDEPITPLMRSILVLSHDPHLRAVARRALERAGCVVATAAHGGQATLALAWGDIEVLVVENELPEGSGKTVAARLRRYCPGLAVVVM